MQSRPERQDASLSTADIVLRVNCFYRCCRQWGLTIQAGPRVPAGLAAAGFAERPADEGEDETAPLENAVSQVGIEPTTRGLKVPCSTTELLAYGSPDFTKQLKPFAAARAASEPVRLVSEGGAGAP